MTEERRMRVTPATGRGRTGYGRRNDCVVVVSAFLILVSFLMESVNATVATTTSIPFHYSDQDLQNCAQEIAMREGGDLDRPSRSTTQKNKKSSSSSMCVILYDAFRLHYHGIGPVLLNPVIACGPHATPLSSSASSTSLSTVGFTHFKNTVQLVQEHNTHANANANAGSHLLRLNQFVDMSKSTIFYSNKQKPNPTPVLDDVAAAATMTKEEEEEEEEQQQQQQQRSNSNSHWEVEVEKLWEKHTCRNENENEHGPSSRNQQLLQ